MKNRGAGEEMLIKEGGIGGTPPSFINCSACSKQIQPKLLAFCHHCHRQICAPCTESHHNSYRLILRKRLNGLSCHTADLKSRVEELKELKASALTTKEKTKDGIVGAIENAVFELCAAASKALDAATAKVEMADLAGFGNIDEPVRRITNLLTKIDKTQNARMLLEGMKDLKVVVAMQKSLKGLLFDAALLREMVESLPFLPVTQMNQSDRFSKKCRFACHHRDNVSGEAVRRRDAAQPHG